MDANKALFGALALLAAGFGYLFYKSRDKNSGTDNSNSSDVGFTAEPPQVPANSGSASLNVNTGYSMLSGSGIQVPSNGQTFPMPMTN